MNNDRKNLENLIEKAIGEAIENNEYETIYAIACGLIPFIAEENIQGLINSYEIAEEIERIEGSYHE